MKLPSRFSGPVDRLAAGRRGRKTRPRRRSFRPFFEPLERRETPSTFVVSNTLDGGPGSLREAILRANASPGPDRVLFAIPTADPNFRDADEDGRLDPGDSWSIGPASALPAVTESLLIDGGSQGGPGYRGHPLVALDGEGAGHASDGLVLADHFGSAVRGLAVERFRGHGVAIRGGGRHALAGNFVGADVTGRLDRGNAGAGVLLADSRSNVVGGAGPGEGNLISGNDFQGIAVVGAASVGNRVVGNLVGTTLSGDAPLGNGSAEVDGDGIRIDGGRDNIIGGRTPAERNVISGNFDDGIDLHDGATGNRILGNFIGTDSTGTRPLGNGVDGIFLQNAGANVIGGLGKGDANVIGGNGFNGVFLLGDSRDNLIAGNFIGTNSRLDAGLGNNVAAPFADGIFLAQFDAPKGPSGNVILRNTLAFNLGTGLSVDVDAGADTVGNRILRNAIFGNGEQAIDLASDGPTANDDGDGDGGPNRSQNSPVFRGAARNDDGTLGATWSLDSTPGSRFRVEFFAGSRDGEAEKFLGSVVVTTDAKGRSGPFRFDYTPQEGKPYLAATATNLGTGDTSELSSARIEIAPPAALDPGPSPGPRKATGRGGRP